jgi:hypothetical protein
MAITKTASNHALQRLDFVLPDFTRLAWVSDRAREVWEPRMEKISRTWLEIEWLAVAEGVRACGLTSVTPEGFIEKASMWAKHGLNGLPLQMNAVPPSSYSATPAAYQPGAPFEYRVVIGRPDDVAEFKSAFDSTDDGRIGQLLGYPGCCQAFFREVWVDAAMVDTTWPMAGNTPRTAPGTTDVTLLDVEGPPESNILWRWMGLRAVPHLPCSFTCESTRRLADRLMQVGRDAGFHEEMAWLLEILSWPVEWSALHGIAEIKTPILKVSSRTDATPVRYTVRYHGDGYPAEGALGLNFPYRQQKQPVVTASASYRRGLEVELVAAPDYPPWYASDNGFTSITAMERLHAPIIQLVSQVLSGSDGFVLDPGCGNGALLRRIVDTTPDIIPYGLDYVAESIEHARTLLPDFHDNFWIGSMFDCDAVWTEDRRYAAILLMPGRLLDGPIDRLAAFRRRLAERCQHIIVYAYGDWLTRYGDLIGLVREAGLEPLDIMPGQTVGLAAVPSE